MKPALSTIVFIILFASCIKGINNLPIVPKRPIPSQPVVIQKDTVPDGGAFKIVFQKDSLQADETEVAFNHTTSTMYFNTQDAVYFPGNGVVSLSSLTSDGVPCAIQQLPYLQGYPIRLKIVAKDDGIYVLRLSYINQIPKTIRIWLKDRYMKDSLDMRIGNYAFQITKADTNTFGQSRFAVALR